MSFEGEGQIVVVVDRRGASIDLKIGKRLGGGGEGTVYVAKPSSSPPQQGPFAVKIFADDNREKKIPKVRAMLEMDPEPTALVRRIAWPLGLVHYRGMPIGYCMPLVPGSELLDATNPLLRRGLNADLDFFCFHWLAENLAKTVTSLHALHHVIGDFKYTNAKFNTETLEVFLIDTDSFGIATHDPSRGFPAQVGTPDWCPPETGPGVQVGIAHDLFSIAVFYHFLLFAVHPFSGKTKRNRADEDTIVASIKEGRWLYGTGPTPNSIDPPLSVIGADLQTLFRRAFEDGHRDPDRRPTAKEWEEAFREARYDLKWCDKHPLHVFDRHCGRCPWCQLRPERWATDHEARSRTIEIARKELRPLTAGAKLSKENFARAERRIAANPAFKTALPDVVARLQSYKQRQDEIDRAIESLRKADKDDIKLIEVANQLRKNPELDLLARTTFGLGRLLDRAAELEGCLNRLNEAVAIAAPDHTGRFRLQSEEKLLDAFQREAPILDGSDGLLLRFAPRRAAARERLEAARKLSGMLGSSGQLGAPIELLRATLRSQAPRLSEIADDSVNGSIGTATLARNIVSLSDNMDRSAADYPDLKAIAFWDQHIAPIGIAVPVLDAERAPGKPPLRSMIDEARRSCGAIQTFERLLQTTRTTRQDIPERDRAIVAADPSPRISTRAQADFQRSSAARELAGALRRVRDTERIEELASKTNKDATDPTLVATWSQIQDRELLGLSPATRGKIKSAEDRMARFERLRPVAMANPPADERLLDMVAAASPSGDLLGIELGPGQTLGSRIALARERIGMRDAVAAAIAAADRTEASLQSEHDIAATWKTADSARRQAPSLFDDFAPRVATALLRVACYQELTSALKDRHGRRAQIAWQLHLSDRRDFAPVTALKPDIDALLTAYRDFRRLRGRAERGAEDTELIALSEQMAEGLELGDAAEPIESLGNRSLKQFIEWLGLRKQLSQQLKIVSRFALDPARTRAELALIADALPSNTQGLELLDDDGLGKSLAAAATAAGQVEALRKAVVDRDFNAFLKLWDESWHPLLPSTADLRTTAQDLAANALTKVSISPASMARVEGNLIRLSWAWPFKDVPVHVSNGHRTNGSEIVTIAFNDRRPPDRLDDAQHVVTVFRRDRCENGSIEMMYDGDCLAASLFTGSVVAGESILTNRPSVVTEARREIVYRFQAANFREKDDWLFLSSREGLSTPPLRIVHAQSQSTIAIIKRQRIEANSERALNLSQLRTMSHDSVNFLRTLQRLMRRELLCYRLELDDPSDQDWIALAHPTAVVDRLLSFLWQEQAAQGDIALR